MTLPPPPSALGALEPSPALDAPPPSVPQAEPGAPPASPFTTRLHSRGGCSYRSGTLRLCRTWAQVARSNPVEPRFITSHSPRLTFLTPSCSENRRPWLASWSPSCRPTAHLGVTAGSAYSPCSTRRSADTSYKRRTVTWRRLPPGVGTLDPIRWARLAARDPARLGPQHRAEGPWPVAVMRYSIPGHGDPPTGPRWRTSLKGQTSVQVISLSGCMEPTASALLLTRTAPTTSGRSARPSVTVGLGHPKETPEA